MTKPLVQVMYPWRRTVAIVCGDREAIAANDCDGLRRRATTRKLRRLLRRKIPSRYPILGVWGTQVPPAAIYGQVSTRDGHPLFPIESDAFVMVELV